MGFNRGPSAGRLTAVTSGAATNFYGYDALGRVGQSFQRTDGVDYGFSYAYNLVGALTSMTYPSGRVVSHSYDSAGRIASVSGVKGAASTTYASSFAYAPHGAIQSLTLGNGLIESTQFNSRLQPTNISLGSLLSLAYNYGLTNNNGNMLSITTTPGAGQTSIAQTFGYDSLNRLQTATETVNAAQSWNQAFGYDRYGNRWFDPATSGAVMGPISSQADISASNNRIVKAGYSYDAAGNMTTEPGKSYTFDGENKIVTALVGSSTSNYVYDGEGRRVKKVTPSGTIVMVYDASSRLVAEYADTVSAGPGGTQYATADHLGTPRLWTSSTGAVISRHDYLPFGEELFSGIGSRSVALSYPPSAQTDGQRNQFTLKERDNETNLDYFLARYYSSWAGRFISPDEFTGGPDDLFDFVDVASDNPTFYADLHEPQSLNKYQYTYNNPLRYTDPDGHGIKDWIDRAVQTTKETINGAANAFNEDNGIKGPGGEQNKLGRALGHVAALGESAVGTIIGGNIAAAGAAGTVATAPATGTVVGAVVPAASAAVAVAGVAIAGASVAVGVNTLTNIFSKSGTAEQTPSGPSAQNSPSVTASGQATDKQGSKLGPSGKPMVHETQSNTREAARNKALNEGSRAVEHRNPRRGKSHFHAADSGGKKKPSSTHHNFPD